MILKLVEEFEQNEPQYLAMITEYHVGLFALFPQHLQCT